MLGYITLQADTHLILPLQLSYRLKSSHQLWGECWIDSDRKSLWKPTAMENFRSFLITPFAFLPIRYRWHYFLRNLLSIFFLAFSAEKLIWLLPQYDRYGETCQRAVFQGVHTPWSSQTDPWPGWQGCTRYRQFFQGIKPWPEPIHPCACLPAADLWSKDRV